MVAEADGTGSEGRFQNVVHGWGRRGSTVLP